MTVRPVDMQVLIPRATDVGRAQQLANQQLNAEQQQFAEQLQQIAASRQHKVQGTPKSEPGKVLREKEDTKQNGHNNDSGQQTHHNKQQSQSVDDTVSAEDPLRGHLIDIKT